MKQFIFWTGMISVVSGLSLQFSQIAQLLMPTEQAGMVMHLFGAMAVFLGVMLIFRSRNLQARGVLVAWEGVLRLFGCAVMVYYGIFGGAGFMSAVSGLFDGAVGVAYLIGLPQHLQCRLSDLLFDTR